MGFNVIQPSKLPTADGLRVSYGFSSRNASWQKTADLLWRNQVEDPETIIFFVQRSRHYCHKGGEDLYILYLHVHLHMRWMLGLEAAHTHDAKATN